MQNLQLSIIHDEEMLWSIYLYGCRKTTMPARGGHRSVDKIAAQRCWASSADGARLDAGAGEGGGGMDGLTASAAWRAALPLAQ